MLIADPQFYLVAIPAVLLLGISKGGFGGALGGVGVPIMSLAISPLQAAAILLPLLCFIDVVGFRVYFRKWDNANLKIMLPGALIGIGIGSLTFGMLSENIVRILVGGIAILFTLNNWFQFASQTKTLTKSVTKGLFWSGLSGFTSFLAHAGGPPAMVYMLSQRMERARFVATISVFFMFVNLVKLVPYAWFGQFSGANLVTSLVLAPLVPVGVWFGVWLQERVNTLWFYRISHLCLFLAGLQLIYQGAVSIA